MQLTLAEGRAPYTVHDRVGRQAEALRLASEGQAWTSGTYASHFSVSQVTAGQDLKQLVAEGSLAAEGSRKTRRYVPPEAD